MSRDEKEKDTLAHVLRRGIILALKTALYVVIILAAAYCPTYLIVARYLEPVYDLPAPRTMAFLSVCEGFALVIIGGTFLERFERRQEGGLAVERRPSSSHIVTGSYDIQYRARPMLGVAFMIAGTLLTVMGIIVIPFYYGL